MVKDTYLFGLVFGDEGVEARLLSVLYCALLDLLERHLRRLVVVVVANKAGRVQRHRTVSVNIGHNHVIILFIFITVQFGDVMLQKLRIKGHLEGIK